MIKYAYYYQFIQLIILFFMHCYWTLFMLKIVFSYAVKPNYSNLYDNKDFKKQLLKKNKWKRTTPWFIKLSDKFFYSRYSFVILSLHPLQHFYTNLFYVYLCVMPIEIEEEILLIDNKWNYWEASKDFKNKN